MSDLESELKLHNPTQAYAYYKGRCEALERELQRASDPTREEYRLRVEGLEKNLKMQAEWLQEWKRVAEALKAAQPSALKLSSKLQQLELENATLKRLAKEVMEKHRTFQDNDYKSCDITPCYWCYEANQILKLPLKTWRDRL